MSKMLPIILAILLASVQAFAVVEIYVSPSGDDNNPGTKDKPLRNSDKASSEASRAADNEDVAVIFEPGEYEPFLLARENKHAITFKAATAGAATISGGVHVKAWQKHTDAVWKAQLTEKDLFGRFAFHQLHVNGKRAQRARGPFPKDAGRYGDMRCIDADAGHTVSGEAMADWKNQDDIELGYFNSWSHMTCKVKAITRDGQGGTKIAMQQPTFFLISRKEGVKAETPEYIENAYELLDEPGEWYYDKAAKTLYYIPRPGEDMEKADAIVPGGTLLDFIGGIGHPISDIRFESITFADGGSYPQNGGHADVQANCVIEPANVFIRNNDVVALHNHYPKSRAAVTVRFGHNIVFDRCTFTRIGGAAIDLDRGCQNCRINGCKFFDISGNAIQIGGTLEESHHPNDERLIVKDNQVTNNYIHDIGVEYQDSVGVFCGYVNGTLIAHNEICSLPYTGISVGWGWGEEDAGGGSYPVIPFLYEKPTPSGNNRIEYNHIHHVMQLRNDGGGIYTLGNQPGTVIRGNHIHDNAHDPGGIYLDEGSGFIEITGNCVYNCSTPMNYNNRPQDRIKTCNEHDNYFNVPADKAPPEVIEKAGLEEGYRDLLK